MPTMENLFLVHLHLVGMDLVKNISIISWMVGSMSISVSSGIGRIVAIGILY